MNHTGTVEIKTARLLLRQFTMEDVETAYQNYGSDPLVNQYISFAPCASLESTKGFLEMHVGQYENNPQFYGWAICLNGDTEVPTSTNAGSPDTVIGSIGLFDVDEELGQAELGYSIGSKWWGKGYATEAAKAVIDHAFQAVGLHRICASHHVDNVASGNVLQKIGMTYEGTIRDGQRNKDGTFSDLKLYGILETD